MASNPRVMVLSLIACGQTAWDVDERLHGRTDLPLSEEAKTSLAEWVRTLPRQHVATIYHPPDEAATETASMIGRHFKAKARRVDELSEPDLGLLEGMRRDEFAERQPSRFRQWEDEPMLVEPPEGEPMAVAARRIYRAVAKLLRRSRSDETAVVLHPIAMGMLRCWLRARRFSDLWSMAANHPRLERYAMTSDLIDELEDVKMEAPVTS